MLDNEPIVGADGPDGDTTAQPPTRPATRRRAASRPAGPPPEDAGSALLTSRPAPEAPAAPGEAAPVVETGAVAEPVEAEAPVKRAPRRRAAAKDPDAPAAPRRTRAKKAAVQPEEVVEVVEAEAAPVKRRRTRKAAEAPPAVAAETPETAVIPEAAQVAGLAEAAAAAHTAGASHAGTPGGATSSGERSSAGSLVEAAVADAVAEVLPEEEPLDDEPAGEDIVEEPQAPTTLFADPFGLSATTAERVTAPPAVTFQSPAAVFQPIFQAPEPRAVVPPAPPAPVRPVEDEAPPEEIEDAADEASADDDDDQDDASGRRRRRRRGGRGRGKGREHDEAEGSEDADDEAAESDQPEQGSRDDEAERRSDRRAEPQAEEEEEEDGGSGSRRRRRRRRRGGEDSEVIADDPPNTVVRIRAPRAGRPTSVDEVQGFRGSTRLEAKKQRRREGREQGRRRPPVITESEFLARRESVERVMVVRRQGGRTQIAVMEDGVLVEHYVDREASQSYVGNVYLGKVQNVLPSMEAAFIDVGKGRNAVLYAGEVNFDTAGLEGQPKRIEVALKSGQSVLVQVTKDPMGHKGARLTSQISLPGRYLVYVPDGSMTGISRKLPDKERSRLKSILKKVMPENAGVIVRTAAEGASEEELSRDVARLSAQWEAINRKAKSASPPELLYSEPDLTIRVVRDVFNEDFASLVVAGDDVWGTLDEYVRYVAPHLADRLTKWEDGDVFAAYRIDEQIAKAMERKVWLPSGGSLVIDRTEAMTVVDVNTGKFTGQGGNLEETVTKNNLEAAEEIVRQLRLRDIGGIIVVDFIDMVLESNRDLVLRRMLECLARDRTKHQVAEVTSLGLVQMTRKRVGQGLLEAFSTPCDCCNGRGLIVSAEPVEAKPEPRGTQGKMAVEKAVAEKLEKAAERILKDSVAVAANGEANGGRESVTGALGGSPDDDASTTSPPARGRRRTRKATRPAGPAE
ncbi:Rne/Rng family ribonuclease [Sphaerisporangium sp. TRM90804]|uniref:Rne/Rng family ribonuclease n=1 Tax=Sphaerisporangium sp. TRM90804 TaxID=3031113 RepID=UPI002448F0E4|nr:Rne/Rng family ribonuclease [Sphaerisporangium sp. TRM90804]MDH2428127.1 Rne/Rng family ribonuclease [Sphaerisporangium sp. TRM90804]